MIETTLEKAAESMHGVLHGVNTEFRGVSIDTRSISSGELFVALQGPNFDGSTFVTAAAERHAAAAVVNKLAGTVIPSITVTDTRLALGKLAASWRAQMSARVVGITGSNGKTTLKELIASCLSESANTLATQGNLNNDIGLPLMLLRLSAEHHYAVLEMGANHAGEIEYLTSLAAPSVVAITNAGPAHLEGFGSVKGVAQAKGEILQSANRPRAAILNHDDVYFDYWRSLVSDLEIVSFGLTSRASVNASDIRIVEAGSTFRLHLANEEVLIELPLQGIHNVRNACAAAAVCQTLDLSAAQIKSGLESTTVVAGRLQPVTGIGGARVFDDSYNANPVSVIAAAEFLAAQSGTSILVLGDMGELGTESESLHKAVGVAAKKAGIDRLLATGEMSRKTADAFGAGADWFSTVDEIIGELRSCLCGGSNVLVKGSRSMRMGRVVRAIQPDSVGVRVN